MQTLPRPRRSSDELGSLLTRHRDALAAQARSYLRNPSDVDDVVQEAFVRLLQSLPDLPDEDQVVAYGRRTVRNLCVDRYRADARRPLQVEIDAALELPLPVSEDPLVRAEEGALVREALQRLTPLHRAALLLREVEEKPLPVVAAELGVAEESAKHLLHRARRSLRRVLDGTQLVPGADPELSLARLAGRGSGRAAALLLALVALLGSGPDLRMVPVVGDDLPDLPSLADVVRPALPGARVPEPRVPEPRVPAPRTASVPSVEAPAGTLQPVHPARPAGVPLSPQPAPAAAAPLPRVLTPSAAPVGTAAEPAPSGSPSAAPSVPPSAEPSTGNSPAPSGQPSAAPTAATTASTPPSVVARPEKGAEKGAEDTDAVRTGAPAPARDGGQVERATPAPTRVEPAQQVARED